MLKKHAQIFEGLFSATDLLVVSFAWVLSYWLRFESGLFETDKGNPGFVVYLKMLIFVWPIWAYVFRRSGLYRPMRGINRYRELWRVAKANAFCVILLLAVTYLFREKDVPFSRGVFLIFMGVSTIMMVSCRSILRTTLRTLRKRGHNLRHVLVVGAGDLAERVLARMLMHPEYGMEMIGCLGPNREEKATCSSEKTSPTKKASSNLAYARQASSGPVQAVGSEIFVRTAEGLCRVPIIGKYSELRTLLEQGGIDQIIVALPLADHGEMGSVIASIGDHMVDVKIVPDFHRFVQLGALIEDFDGLPVMSLASTPLTGLNQGVKRVFDLLVGSFVFVLTLPLMFFIALAIKLSSRGPVFFTQERVGLDGHKFQIYKFRTMGIDAESDGARFAVPGDSRVTALGRFLRRSNLDELPQLVNVLCGQMSLVGPRPERPVFIKEFRQHLPRYMLRHKVQAGMTGWAQVNGWRGNTSIERRIEHDLYYIEHWSLLLDVKILVLTLVNSFRDRNAY